MAPIASVIIPAHDEESVIARCLTRLLADAAPGELEVIVVANGCSDRTAEVARDATPDATVLDLEVASKTAALNAGDQAATCYPRAYLDADIELTTDALRAVVAELDTGSTLCCAPRMELELADRPWYVRAFFRVFLEQPYAGGVGNGLYVLSRAARERFGAFPDVTGDDLFVRNLFAPDERATVRTATYLVHPPRDLAGLLAVRERSYRGNAEHRSRGYPASADPTRDPRRLLRTAVRRPLDMAVYVTVNLTAMARLRFRRREVRWERDESARR
jgi:glycosyltransferase involved in cell wall biosynthesis